jgi:hypothetical protein
LGAEILAFLHGNQSPMHSLYSNLGWSRLNQQLGSQWTDLRHLNLRK